MAWGWGYNNATNTANASNAPSAVNSGQKGWGFGQNWLGGNRSNNHINQQAQQNQQNQQNPQNQWFGQGWAANRNQTNQANQMNPSSWFQGSSAGRQAPPIQPNQSVQQRQNPMPQQRLATPEEMGITFEPIESLFSGAKSSELPTEPPPQAPAQFFAGQGGSLKQPDSIKTSIGNFIQNERNGSLFYTHLSELAGMGPVRSALENTASTCRTNSQGFARIYKQYCGEDFVINESKINTGVGLREGIKWAISEEGLAIKDLSALYELPEMDAYYRQLSVIMGRKTGDLGILVGLIS